MFFDIFYLWKSEVAKKHWSRLIELLLCGWKRCDMAAERNYVTIDGMDLNTSTDVDADINE